MRVIKTKNTDKKKYDFETIMFIIIFILAENSLYLFDYLNFTIGPFRYDDMAMIVYIIFGIYIILKYRDKTTPKFKYKFVCMFSVILVLTSSFTSWRLYGQSIIKGISPQRGFVISYLMYFLMAKYFWSNKENYYKFEKAMYLVGTCELILYTIQYLLGPGRLFLYIVPSDRFGEMRLMFAANLLYIFAFVILNNLLNGRNIKKNLFLFVFICLYFLIVAKTRIVVLAMGISVVILFMIWKKNILIKFSVIFIALGLSIVLLRAPLFQNYLKLINPKIRHSDATYMIRNKGKEYYKSEIEKSPILGRGYPNEKYKIAMQATLPDKGYVLIDDGFVGFTYIYGLIGALWFICLVIQMSIDSLKLYFRRNDYSILGYLIFCLAIVSNIMHLYWLTGGLYNGMVLGILEDTSKDKKS